MIQKHTFRMRLALLSAAVLLGAAGCAQIQDTEADIPAELELEAAIASPYFIPNTISEETETAINTTEADATAYDATANIADTTATENITARETENLPVWLAQSTRKSEDAETEEQQVHTYVTTADTENSVHTQNADNRAAPRTSQAENTSETTEEAAAQSEEETCSPEELAAEEQKRRAEVERIREAALAKKKAKEEAERVNAAAKEAAEKKAACPGYSEEYVSTLTEAEQAEAEHFYDLGYVFYRQNWSVTKELSYGDDTFGQCGCGPTCTAAIVSNLAGVAVTPEDMRNYAIETNAYIPHVGTTYNMIMTVTASYGIKATNTSSKDAVIKALKAGKLVLVSMGPGDFTLGAHFMLYRGITEEGKILIADSYSYDLSVKEWDWDDLEAQLKNGYYIFEKE